MADEDENEEGVARYVAYLRTLKAVARPALRSLKQIQKNRRVLVHSAEVGDAFRPISLPPAIYFAANAISLCYVSYEVFHSFQLVYHSSEKNTRLASVIASKTFLFEVIASLALPAGMIHGIVHSTEAIIHHTFPSPEQLASVTRKEIQSLKLSQIARSYGPTTLGLLSIPFMPMIFDRPVNRLLDHLYLRVFPDDMQRFQTLKVRTHPH